MIGNKKVIGICITKMQDTPRSRAIDYLHKEATKHDYKLMLFNSAFDVTESINADIGVGGIYDFINYDIIDALVIYLSGFFDEDLYRTIVDKAISKNIPVILEDREYPNCYTIQNSIEAALEDLINHVIRDHHITDTFFIAGIKGNEFSDKRIAVYKKVLMDNGLPFDESMVDYGDFWEWPTRAVMDRLFMREKLPKAIICANDAMAVAACDYLAERGMTVPDDIIVTGFDGSPRGMFSTPKLTTCDIDLQGFSEKCMDILDAHFRGECIPKFYTNPYTFKKSESCGCLADDDIDFKHMAKQYHHLFTDMNGHEYVIYNQIIYQLNASGMDNNEFFGAVSQMLDSNSYLSIRPAVLNFSAEPSSSVDALDENMLIISANSAYSNRESLQFKAADIVPNLHEWANDDSLYVISAIQVGKNIFGLHQAHTDNIIRDSQKINRILSIINTLVHMAFSDVRQRYLRTKRDIDTKFDYVTELANREGITDWYNTFSSAADNKDKILALSLYHLPKYSYIYENYGMEETKALAIYIAEALKIANPKDSVIAHPQDDEFIVINYYNSETELSNDIDCATKVFWGIIESFNAEQHKEYNLEVCAGCTTIPLKKPLRFETLVRRATDELYKNSSKYKSTPVVNSKHKTSKKQYELFNALISHNLFYYHFQPIVSAETGEIYGYEALMRTDEAIGLSPLDVIAIAQDYQRLYDIEYATMFNVMDRYSKSPAEFMGRKIFINCLPGHFLNSADNERLCELYSKYIDTFVFEITEQDTLTTDELSKVRHLGNEHGNNPVAVDDYGTGHSNLVNLINYAPQVVKIDRFLMTDIHKDSNKQMLVKGVIDFAKANDIKILAEGIETSEELKKVIELGVDYIQGFYTGRPVANPIFAIDASIKEEISTTYNNFH